jgi:toxin ParE1/3/4
MAVVRPYLIRYRIRDDAVVILRIRHGAREED